MKKRISLKKIKFPKSLSKSATVFLRILLPLILIESIFLLAQISSASTAVLLRNFDMFVYTLEHIFMSILLCVGGFVVLDLAEREKERENK